MCCCILLLVRLQVLVSHNRMKSIFISRRLKIIIDTDINFALFISHKKFPTNFKSLDSLAIIKLQLKRTIVYKFNIFIIIYQKLYSAKLLIFP